MQTAEMMYGTEYTYLENDLATGFVKPYADGYSFVALLPHEGLSMADFVKGLSKDTFARAWKVEKETPGGNGIAEVQDGERRGAFGSAADHGYPRPF